MKSAGMVFGEGDTLYGRLRPYLNKVCRPPFDGVASAEFIVFKATPALAPGFLLYFLSQPDFVSFATLANEGDRPRVKWSQLASYPVKLPPLDEQRRIVAAIEEQFSRLDVGVASLERAKRNIARVRASILSAAVTGRLVPQDPTDEPAAVLLANVGAAVVARRRPKLRRIDLNGLPPSGWAQTRIADVVVTLDYGSSAKATSEPDAGVPILRMGNIQDGEILFDDLKYLPTTHPDSSAFVLTAGDLLFNRTNSPELVGKCAVFRGADAPVAFASYLVRARTAPGVDPRYLSFWINSSPGRKYIAEVRSQQVGQANVNATKLAEMPIWLPPEAEQTRIVEEVDRHLSVLKSMSHAIEVARLRANRLRQAILREAFTGRLTSPASPGEFAPTACVCPDAEGK